MFLCSAATPPIFSLITVVLFSVVVVSLILSRFKQSLMAGYFLCGVILANCGLMNFWEQSGENITLLSDIGVILLMFTLGIEFSIEELKHLRRFALIGGGIQMSLCALVFGVCLYFGGLSFNVALVLALVVGLSSTAVALKSFQESNSSGTVAAKLALGIALFQDILAILLMATLPQIFDKKEHFWGTLWGIVSALLVGVLFLLCAALFGKYILPKIMNAVARTRSRELFTLSVLALCACIAVTGSYMGLSLALGAFAAGLVVSGSYYSHRVLAEILPFRDVFLTIFFVSAGLLVDIQVISENWGWILISLLGVILIKFLAVMLAGSKLGLTGSMAGLASTSVANVGEFSLVIIAALHTFCPLPNEVLQCVFAIAALSMGITPSLMKLVRRFNDSFDRCPLFRKKKNLEKMAHLTEKIIAMEGHAIICGYGPVGKRLHEALGRYGIHTLIVDLNADTVKKLLSSGTPALLGDIRHGETMSLVGVKRARLIAFTFPDISPALAAQPEIRALNDTIHIIARAKFPSEVERLWQAGIKTIIHDEAEVGTAMEQVALSVFDFSLQVKASTMPETPA